MVERPLDHEHLRSIGGVPNTDQRCRLPDLVAHGADATQAATGRGTTLMRMDARESVAHAIKDHGPISFAEYMTLALYGPGGFFERPPIGPDGHFVTSPHVHPVFAELLGRAIVDLRDRLGEPRPLRLSEVGAGDGTLARQLVEHLGDLEVAYTAIDPSPELGLRSRRSTASRSPATLEGSPQLIIANELLDNLPFRRLRGTASGTKEVLVALRGGSVRRAPRRPAARRGPPSGGGSGDGPPGWGDGVHRGGRGPARPPGLCAPDRLRRRGRAGRPAPRVPRTPTGGGPARPTGRDRHHLRSRLRPPQAGMRRRKA